MPRRSKITTLDAATKAWLEQELINRGFSGYEELEQLLSARGYRIGKSIIHRHGEKLERKIETIKASTEAARLIMQASPDEEDALTGSVISMIQSDTFEVLLALQEAGEADPAERLKLLNKAARAASDLARASIAQKRWSAGVREKLDAAKQQAVAAAEKVAQRTGLSDEDWGLIRARILGIEVGA